jgi:hypothetical protein
MGAHRRVGHGAVRAVRGDHRAGHTLVTRPHGRPVRVSRAGASPVQPPCCWACGEVAGQRPVTRTCRTREGPAPVPTSGASPAAMRSLHGSLAPLARRSDLRVCWARRASTGSSRPSDLRVRSRSGRGPSRRRSVDLRVRSPRRARRRSRAASREPLTCGDGWGDPLPPPPPGPPGRRTRAPAGWTVLIRGSPGRA